MIDQRKIIAWGLCYSPPSFIDDSHHQLYEPEQRFPTPRVDFTRCFGQERCVVFKNL